MTTAPAELETEANATDERPSEPMTRVPEGVTSPRAKLVYLYLATHGAVDEDALCDGLGMKRISLYSILNTLRSAGHVERVGDRYALA